MKAGAIACVMFAGDRKGAGISHEGRSDKVIVLGARCSVYERDGSYQLYVQRDYPGRRRSIFMIDI